MKINCNQALDELDVYNKIVDLVMGNSTIPNSLKLAITNILIERQNNLTTQIRKEQNGKIKNRRSED